MDEWLYEHDKKNISFASLKTTGEEVTASQRWDSAIPLKGRGEGTTVVRKVHEVKPETLCLLAAGHQR